MMFLEFVFCLFLYVFIQTFFCFYNVSPGYFIFPNPYNLPYLTLTFIIVFQKKTKQNKNKNKNKNKKKTKQNKTWINDLNLVVFNASQRQWRNNEICGLATITLTTTMTGLFVFHYQSLYNHSFSYLSIFSSTYWYAKMYFKNAKGFENRIKEMEHLWLAWCPINRKSWIFDQHLGLSVENPRFSIDNPRFSKTTWTFSW